MKPKFVLPSTAMSIVVFYRDGKLQEELIDTPRSNEALFTTMLKFGVGYSMIRAVKPVDGGSLTNSINFNNISHRRVKA